MARPLSVYVPVVVAEARGAVVTDVDGNSFIDFTGGVGCLNVGHASPGVVAAASEQLARFTHTDFTEHFGVEPDLVTVAKSIAGGLPLSSVIGRAQLMDAPADNAIGGTFPGNPVACAAALAVLDTSSRTGSASGPRRSGPRFAPGWRPGATAIPRWATCGGWAPCSPSSSCATG